MTGYEEIFNQRGKSYHVAMQKYPHARDQEFRAGLSCIALKPGETLLDIPAGGGYLKHHLAKDVNYIGLDFSGAFDEDYSGIIKCTETSIDLKNNSVDHVITLAALHHMTEREAFYKEIKRIIKPAGNFVIGDVIVGSIIDDFLNGFLNDWNGMGHNGNFIIPNREIDMISDAGFEVQFNEIDYSWEFDSQSDARFFFRLLFGMDRNPSDDLLDDKLRKLGISKQPLGIGINWSLGFLEAVSLDD
jgi:SAM-dependent methyltransferase